MPAPAQVRASGGGIASPLWRQILADVLGRRDRDRQHDRGRRVRRRAARRRRRRLVRTSVEDAAGSWCGSARRPRRARMRRAYAEAHAAYRELYPALAAVLPPTSRRSRRAELPSSSCARPPSRSPPPGCLPRMIIAEHLVGRDVVLVHRADEPAVVHDADPVGQVEDVVDVVADEEDADALALELPDQVADLGRLGRARAPRSARP